MGIRMESTMGLPNDLQHRAKQPSKHQPLGSDQARKDPVPASMPSKREEGNERRYGYDQTNRACQGPRTLQGRAAGTDGAVATESVGSESDGDTEHEEVSDGKQAAQAKERKRRQLAAARGGPSHRRILGFRRMSLKLRPLQQPCGPCEHCSNTSRCRRCGFRR